MDAPLYLPARRFERPQLLEVYFGVDSVPIADLVRSPTIRAMLMREIPGFERILGAGQLQQHLSNFTLRNLAEFGAISAEPLPRIDALLRATPANERPAYE